VIVIKSGAEVGLLKSVAGLPIQVDAAGLRRSPRCSCSLISRQRHGRVPGLPRRHCWKAGSIKFDFLMAHAEGCRRGGSAESQPLGGPTKPSCCGLSARRAGGDAAVIGPGQRGCVAWAMASPTRPNGTAQCACHRQPPRPAQRQRRTSGAGTSRSALLQRAGLRVDGRDRKLRAENAKALENPGWAVRSVGCPRMTTRCLEIEAGRGRSRRQACSAWGAILWGPTTDSEQARPGPGRIDTIFYLATKAQPRDISTAWRPRRTTGVAGCSTASKTPHRTND